MNGSILFFTVLRLNRSTWCCYSRPMVLYWRIYIAPLNSHGKQRRFWFD